MKILLLLVLFAFNAFALNNKNVLILNSYHKGFEVSDTIIKNIETKFYSNKDINIDILYMDAKQIYSRDYIKQLSTLYSLQLKNRSYDLIITIDRFAYKFVVKNYSSIFKNEKILFTGVEQFSKELAKVYGLEDKIYGIIQKLQIQDNINLILKTIPNLSKLYILNDRSPSGNDSSSYIIKAINHIKSKIDVEYIRDDTLDDLKKLFSNKKKNEAILFVRYSNNPNGIFYKTNEVIEAINKFELPVFVTDDLFLKKGVLGGKVISIENLASLTAKKAINILYNNKNNINIQINNEFEYIFDQNLLYKYKLNIPHNLKNYKIVNAPISFFDKHRKLTNAVFMLSPILVLIITILIFVLYSKHTTAKKLKQRIEFDKVLLNSINSPIFWHDFNGDILDANQKFCELIDIPYTYIHNKNLSDFKNTNYFVNKILFILDNYEKNNLKNSQFLFKNKLNEKKIYNINNTKYIDSNTNQTAYVTIFTDITKEKELENERLKQNQYMVQQSKLAEIGEIFSSIAHQWKSPLVAITALAQDLFYSQNTNEKEEDSYHINNIMLQVKYMTKTINEFQDFIIPSKEKNTFNVEHTIEALLNIVKHTMKYSYIHINVSIKENTKLDIYGYENELMQSILNIINNAKDALLKNNRDNRKITINLYNKKNSLYIDIIDNGSGILKNMRKKIFLQYFSTKETGNGIGLYMTKLIIEDKMNGKIQYKKLNDGSLFRIKLKQNTKG